MAPLHSTTGLIAVFLATSCTGFVVPGSRQTILRQSPSRPATASTTVGLRSTTSATCLRATRLPFATTDGDEDANAGPASRGARPSAAGLVDSRRQTAAGALKAASGAGAGEGRDGDDRDLTAVRRALLLAIWLPFTIYAFGPWSPGATGDPKDIELVTHLYDGPVMPETAIFTAVFNALGFLPAITASMLVGGGSFAKGRQPVPAPPFVFGAFALGFFSLGPYLAVRNYLPQAAGDEGEEMSTLEKVLTSKVLAVPLLALSAYVVFSLVSALTDPEAISAFGELFWSSKLAHISTMDLCVLSTVIIDPIREDMRRRGVEPELAKVALFSVPLVGPAAWMLVRPPVE
ncbi:unnamed protein product [Ectocarpus sp. 12 AP-2014]